MDIMAILGPVLETISGLIAQLGLEDVINQVLQFLMGITG